MIKNLINKPLHRFIFLAFFLFLIWEIFYENWLHPQGSFDKIVISNIIYLSSKLIDFLGVAVVPEQPFDENFRTLAIDGGHSVWIGDPCNGITLMALFAGFVLAYPGKLFHKFWFIPLGLFFVHFVNVIRVTALAFLAKFYPEYLEFNHTYTFTLLVYSFVFFLWMIWAKYFGSSLNEIKS